MTVEDKMLLNRIDDFLDNKTETITLTSNDFVIIKQSLKLKEAVGKIRKKIDKLPDLNPDYPMDRTIHVSKWAVIDIIDKHTEGLI